MMTTELAVAVPTRVGRASSVTPLLTTSPVMLPTLSSTLVMLTSIGAASTLKFNGSLAVLVLPALSVRVTLML
ncbi:hypothetical protein D9M68_825550 [compost metagenome]